MKSTQSSQRLPKNLVGLGYNNSAMKVVASVIMTIDYFALPTRPVEVEVSTCRATGRPESLTETATTL